MCSLTLWVLGKSTQTGPESPPNFGGEGHGALKEVPLKVFGGRLTAWVGIIAVLSSSVAQACFPINVSNLI